MPGRDIENDLRQVAESLVLADMMFRKGRIIEAEPMYEKTLAMLIRTYAEAHPDVDACLLRLSDIYFSREKFAQALSTYSRLYNVRCSTKGLHHLDTLSISFKIAKTEEKLERYEEAARTYEAAVADGEQFLLPGNLLVGSMMESYALLLRRQLNNPQRAAEIEQRAKDFRKRGGSKTTLIRPRMPDKFAVPEPEPLPNTAAIPNPAATPNSAATLAPDPGVVPSPAALPSPVASQDSAMLPNPATNSPTQSPRPTSTQSGLAAMQGSKTAPRKALSAFVDSKAGLNDRAEQSSVTSPIVEVTDEFSNLGPKTVFTGPLGVSEKQSASKSPFVGAESEGPKPYVSGTPYIAEGLRHRSKPASDADSSYRNESSTNFNSMRHPSDSISDDGSFDSEDGDEPPLDEDEYYDDDDFDEERPESKNFLLMAFVVLIALIVPIFIGWTMMNKSGQSFMSHPNPQPASFGATTIPMQEGTDANPQAFPLRSEPSESQSAPKPALRRRN